MSARIVHDALAGKSVVMFRTPDANDDDVDAVSKIVGQAGGTVTGTVALTQEFVDANSAEKLLSVVNSLDPARGRAAEHQAGRPGIPGRRPAGHRAADQPGSRSVPPVDDAQRDTVLAALRDTGFIDVRQPAHRRGQRRADRHRRRAAATTPATRASRVARFAAALAPHGSGTVLAGRDGSATGTAAVGGDPVRRRAVSPAVSTVDDVDAESGRITAVLALHDLINGGRHRPVRHRPRARHRSITAAVVARVRAGPPSSRRPAVACQRRRVGVGVRVGFRGSAGPS